MSAGISIRHLNKSYGALHVLRDIDLEVEPGEFTVLLGPSGCGKSTLLNTIAGLDETTDGEIRIGGTDVTDEEPSRRGIAMVFQSYALYPTMSVRQNLTFGLKVNHVPRAEIGRRVAWVADLLQIRELLDRKPGQLSGGQRQRVAIGRALVREAKVFLFDEPLSNLDAKLRTEMRVEIKRLHQKLGSTIVYVTHDQIEAMTLATRIAVMRGGVVQQYADPQTLYERPATLFVAGFVGSPAMNLVPATLSTAGGLKAVVGSQSLPLEAYPFAERLSDGQPIVVGLRPEDISLADETGGAAQDVVVEAALRFTEPMGADTLCWFDWAGRTISVRLPPDRARGLPHDARLRFDISKASVFSAETENRL
ncbi:carbohydrate ABC transporter ATP-binding protein, CUT1 family [Faunimonas pinastri]|uniref:Carbohydrate ABC transporter ATP-binding protein, CUT1 family n=1 Tax=Faunimonas pinastri TaxID=1855383 RepID=A0A1H9IFC6_9HYPH|nr:sn-glycerol-3-phosphate ABC transporter ATP-binding protein UgpC [Faunimonas pinastri]SEQ73276.1 carbohydrate ABC transporter ATP-binding protein, CUT1 family [Faunimonas pinastri]